MAAALDPVLRKVNQNFDTLLLKKLATVVSEARNPTS